MTKFNLNESEIPSDRAKRISHMNRLISQSRKIIKLLYEWVSLKQDAPALEMVCIGEGRNIITYLDKNLAILEQDSMVSLKTLNELRTNISFLHGKCDEQ